MSKEVCPLCEKRISDWEMACGKIVHIDGKLCHKSCVMDHDYSVAELEKKVKSA